MSWGSSVLMAVVGITKNSLAGRAARSCTSIQEVMEAGADGRDCHHESLRDGSTGNCGWIESFFHVLPRFDCLGLPTPPQAVSLSNQTWLSQLISDSLSPLSLCADPLIRDRLTGRDTR